MSLTVTDLFCGAGGSSIGAEMVGCTLRLGLNHWERAIETHAQNFQHADHDCEDVSSLTTAQIRRYPDSDILLASPECTNHSLAKGARRRKPQAASLFEDGPAGDAEQDRSRATMWDVVRFAEQKLLKGKPYKAIVVENVVDAFNWGPEDNGTLFDLWVQAVDAIGYHHEVVWLNSMFAGAVPQSRDRMYVVFWKKGVRTPNLRFEPLGWCPACEKLTHGVQSFKKQRPGRNWGRYGPQYVFRCRDCTGAIFPGAHPAATAIDWSLPGQVIGERKKPLADATRERIRRGLERLASEPFAIRLLQSGNPKPLTLPLVTLTGRHDLAMVTPVAGNTFERTPGNRARNADQVPLDTVHGTLDRALVCAGTENAVMRDVETDEDPVHTIKAGGQHHMLVMRNNNSRGDSGNEVSPSHEPIRTMTASCPQSLVMRNNKGGAEMAIAETFGDDDIDACRFRMFELHEISRAMSMHEHPGGGDYVVVGNKRERMAQYGNAVTPPAMQALVGRLLEVLS